MGLISVSCVMSRGTVAFLKRRNPGGVRTRNEVKASLEPFVEVMAAFQAIVPEVLAVQVAFITEFVGQLPIDRTQGGLAAREHPEIFLFEGFVAVLVAKGEGVLFGRDGPGCGNRGPTAMIELDRDIHILTVIDQASQVMEVDATGSASQLAGDLNAIGHGEALKASNLFSHGFKPHQFLGGHVSEEAGVGAQGLVCGARHGYSDVRGRSLHKGKEVE
jgi:hypothetical protein